MLQYSCITSLSTLLRLPLPLFYLPEHVMDNKNMTLFVFYRYRGPMHAFSVIYQQRGFRGLWRGWAPNVQRAALVNMGGTVL